MAQVKVFQGGTIQRQGLTNAREQAVDYGPSALEAGLKTIGNVTGKVVDEIDQLEDINATIESNRLAVEHSELARGLGRKVKQAMGENAEAAADAATVDLDKGTNDIIARASPRARMKLQSTLTERASLTKDNWLDHSFGEKKTAFDTNTQARLTTIREDANDEPDETRALALLSQSKAVLEERARFFGHGPDKLKTDLFAYTSDYFKSRAIKKASGDNGSASAAIEYATSNRRFMSDDAYNAVLTAYDDAATDERVAAEVNGEDLPSATAATVEIEPAFGEGGVGVAPPMPSATPAVARRLDPNAFFNAFTVPHEGASYVIDSNGAGVKYGINAEYNPGVDVKNLTQDGAARIFRKNYFEKSGADKLPPALAAVHVDTFYLNERQAAKILKQSGGDVDRYIELRHAFLNSLVAKNPAKYGKYQKGWANRTNALAKFADRQGGDGTAEPIPIAINTSMRSVEEAVMARTDVGLKYKRKLIAAYRDKRAGMAEERSQRESEAMRIALGRALELGDGFTSITQLGPIVEHLGPSGIQSFTGMAKGNVKEAESKPLDPGLAQVIEFTAVANPEYFASKEFTAELVKRGAPLATIRSVAARQGSVAGQLANPKAATPLSDGTVWSVAKPAFEAAGLLFDTVESKGGANTGKERKADAARKTQALTYLQSLTRQWMAANPGKSPPAEVVKGWVGTSLLRSNGVRAFEMTDQQTYLAIPAGQRQRIMADLYRGRPPADQQTIMQDVIRVHRNVIAARGGMKP